MEPKPEESNVLVLTKVHLNSALALLREAQEAEPSAELERAVVKIIEAMLWVKNHGNAGRWIE